MRGGGGLRAAARLLAGALLLWPGVPAGAQEGPATASAPAAAPPALYLQELSVQPSGGELTAGELRQALSEWWETRAAPRLSLADLPGGTAGASGTAGTEPAGSTGPGPTLWATVRIEAGRGIAEVRLIDRGGRELRSRTTVFSAAPGALAAALGGEILGLWVRLRGYPDAEYAPPRLAALLDLSALAALEQGPGPGSEPLDCAAGPDGPLLLFSDRTLRLGRRFELTPGSLRDLALREPLPEGFVPSRLAVDPWAEPVVYGEGALLRYRPDAFAPDRSALPALGAQDATGLPGGGMAVLSPGRVTVLSRFADGLGSAEIPVPSPFWVSLCAGPDGALWLYDLEERKIRMVGPPAAPPAGALAFAELHSIRPLVSPEDLPFPQVLAVFPDGGFVLGGAGELWRFDPAGWPLWRLREFGAGVRQSLPAFYRVTVESERVFYLLDPLSRRLLRFVDFDDGPLEPQPSRPGAPAPAPRFAAPPAAADVELAGLLRRWTEGGAPARAALSEACLARDLLLMGRSLFPAGAPAGRPTGPEAEADPGPVPDRTLRTAQARRLAELGAGYAEALLLPEAEAAYNAALRVLRALRAADPVDPEFPERIRELERRRNAVREILIAVPPVELLRPSLAASGSGGGREITLALRLRNPTGTPLRDLRYQVSLPGLPGGVLAAEMPRLAGGGTATLNATVAAPAPFREDLPTRVLVLVTATAGDQEQTFWLESPLVVPAAERPWPNPGSSGYNRGRQGGAVGRASRDAQGARTAGPGGRGRS